MDANWIEQRLEQIEQENRNLQLRLTKAERKSRWFGVGAIALGLMICAGAAAIETESFVLRYPNTEKMFAAAHFRSQQCRLGFDILRQKWQAPHLHRLFRCRRAELFRCTPPTTASSSSSRRSKYWWPLTWGGFWEKLCRLTSRSSSSS